MIIKQGTTETLYYAETDRLGSIIGLINPDGTYAEHYSYDAWGRRRNPSDWSFDNVPVPTLIDRGYTGQEHLDEFNLINMNGRMYDPLLGRFASVDPVIQYPDNSQSFNGYGYCLNNPLKYSDPSGMLMKAYDESDAALDAYSHYMSDMRTDYDFRNIFSSGGGYHYNSYTGNYNDAYGNVVTYGEVYNNYIVPNSYYSANVDEAFNRNGTLFIITEDGTLITAAQYKPDQGPTACTDYFGGASDRQLIDIDFEKAIKYLEKWAKPKSIHKCAEYVINALTIAGGAEYRVQADYAKDFGPTLVDMGFNPISHDNYNSQVGDVVIYDSSSASKFGHMVMFCRTEWISDYHQGNQCNPYEPIRPNYTIYRFNWYPLMR